jgi:tetratricopeptide (TPR) repeat protein
MGRTVQGLRAIRVLLVLLATAAVVSANGVTPEALIEGGHWKRLAATAEQRLRANPNDARAHYWMAMAKFQYQDYDGAQALAEKAVALDPKNADHHYVLGIIYGRQAERANVFRQPGLAGKFKKETEQAIALDPRHINARNALIDFHLQAPGIVGGDKKRAHQYADEILQIDAARGWLAKARIARREKQTDQLESFYRKAVEANPQHYGARLALAGYYAAGASAQLDWAEKHAREAVAIAPDRAGAYALLAALYAQQQRWKDLDAILAQAEKSVPDNLSPFYFAARNLLAKGAELPRAEGYLRKYLTQPPEPDAPSHAHARWRLGNAVEKLGRSEEACREYREAVRLDDKLEDAKKDLKRLCR